MLEPFFQISSSGGFIFPDGAILFTLLFMTAVLAIDAIPIRLPSFSRS